MALPSAMSTWSGVPERSGIVVGLYPSTLHRLAMELHYSTQTTASTSSTKWTIRRIPASSASLLQQTVVLPLSTKRWYFKARHKDVGWANGAFTAVVNARPVVLGSRPLTAQVRYGLKGNVELPGADLWLQSTKTAKVGTQATTARITKRVRFSHAGMLPESTDDEFTRLPEFTYPRKGSPANAIQALFFPPNVRLTAVRARLRHAAGSTGT